MSSSPFEIKVVFDASQRKRRGAVVRTAHRGGQHASGVGLILGALLNLAIAGGIYYVTWWKADPHIYMVFMQRLPLDVPSEFASNPLGFSAATFEAMERAAEEAAPAVDESAPGPRWSGKTAQAIIPVTAYAWLTFATASACALALAGGAWLGLAGGSTVRMLGLVGVVAMTAFLGYAGYNVWQESQRMFEPNQLRRGMGMVALLFALIGVSLAARARGITRFAGFTVVVAAFVTGAAVWLWAQSGALDFQYAHWTKPGAAFAIHAAWGVVLLVTASRMRA